MLSPWQLTAEPAQPAHAHRRLCLGHNLQLSAHLTLAHPAFGFAPPQPDGPQRLPVYATGWPGRYRRDACSCPPAAASATRPDPFFPRLKDRFTAARSKALLFTHREGGPGSPFGYSARTLGTVNSSWDM